jgi:hypothetical protein
MTIEKILADYGDLDREDILAAAKSDFSLLALMGRGNDDAHKQGLPAEILESVLRAEE